MLSYFIFVSPCAYCSASAVRQADLRRAVGVDGDCKKMVFSLPSAHDFAVEALIAALCEAQRAAGRRRDHEPVFSVCADARAGIKQPAANSAGRIMVPAAGTGIRQAALPFLPERRCAVVDLIELAGAGLVFQHSVCEVASAAFRQHIEHKRRGQKACPDAVFPVLYRLCKPHSQLLSQFSVCKSQRQRTHQLCLPVGILAGAQEQRLIGTFCTLGSAAEAGFIRCFS